MFTNVLALAFLGVVAVNAGITIDTQYRSWDWNSLLGSDDVLFAEGIAAIQSKSFDRAVVVAELNSLLDQEHILAALYKNYADIYNKEDANSAETFKANLIQIAEHNVDAKAGKHFWEMGVNQFTDMTYEEIAARHLTNNIDLRSLFQNSSIAQAPSSQAPTATPKALDWRTKKAVSPVKDQKNCGSCVAFSVTGTLEAAHAVAHQVILDLSEQQLVDCARGDGNNGCNGMTFVPTFKYIQEEGLVTEEKYPYTAEDGSCSVDENSAPDAKAKSWTPVRPEKNEKVLQDNVAKAPLAIAVHVNDGFMRYKKGIYAVTEECQGGRNHAVGLVGYGAERSKDFWIIKNSWSESWGEKGFIRLSRNNKNKCDVAGDAVYLVAE